MKKALGLILAGLVTGALTAGVGLRVSAQARPQAPIRLLRSSTQTMGYGNLSFIKDAKSGGCWLFATSILNDPAGKPANQTIALAVAPESACEDIK